LEKKKYCISVPIIMKKCIIVETDNLQETLAKVIHPTAKAGGLSMTIPVFTGKRSSSGSPLGESPL